MIKHARVAALLQHCVGLDFLTNDQALRPGSDPRPDPWPTQLRGPPRHTAPHLSLICTTPWPNDTRHQTLDAPPYALPPPYHHPHAPRTPILYALPACTDMALYSPCKLLLLLALFQAAAAVRRQLGATIAAWSMPPGLHHRACSDSRVSSYHQNSDASRHPTGPRLRPRPRRGR